ncbi:MAG: 3-deoxy-manno-octulosonate cytidylyltransferase [Saprospirales bacterium]|nr:MAG: 3-deoxy-manno-octulosonate cytidylyltransferase [Saprospirales bacterium]
MWKKNYPVVAIIPARYESMRLPGKPLINIGTKCLLQRVYENVRNSNFFDRVIIATDHRSIHILAESLGAEVFMTSPDHVSGTDRCAEVARQLEGSELLVNVQGDEIITNWEGMEELINMMQEGFFEVGTLASPIVNREELFSPNAVKVVFDRLGKALYFSRSVIPFVRDIPQEDWINQAAFYRHIGVYAYSNSVLQDISSLDRGCLEKSENLEQLRWMEYGYDIGIVESALWESVGIDTESDLLTARSLFLD